MATNYDGEFLDRLPGLKSVADFRDEAARADALASSVQSRWAGWDVASSSPISRVVEKLSAVIAARDAFLLVEVPDGVSEHVLHVLPVSWVLGTPQYTPETERLMNALLAFYRTASAAVDAFPATTWVGDVLEVFGVGVPGFLGDTAKKAGDAVKPALWPIGLGLAALAVVVVIVRFGGVKAGA